MDPYSPKPSSHITLTLNRQGGLAGPERLVEASVLTPFPPQPQAQTRAREKSGTVTLAAALIKINMGVGCTPLGKQAWLGEPL